MSAAANLDSPVVVASLGRSGSTLMLRLLNLSPDITIWGEHAAFLIDIMSAVETIENARPLVGGRKRRDTVIGPLHDTDSFIPWVSPFGTREFKNQTRAYVKRLFTQPLPKGVRWGFKEIRYRAEHLEAFRRLFPAAQFIFIVRDAKSQVLSRVQSFNDPAAVFGEDEPARIGRLIRVAEEQWIARHVGYLRFVEEAPQDCLVEIYDTSSDPVFDARRIFDFIGLPTPDDAALASVFAHKVGSKEDQAKGHNWSVEHLARLKAIVDGSTLDPVAEHLYGRFVALSRS